MQKALLQLLVSSLISTIALHANPTEILIDKEHAPSLFTTTANPEGTLYRFLDHLNITNLDTSQSPQSLSCFTNIEGPLTFSGNNYSGYFHNVRSSTQGLVVHQSSSAPLTLSSFSSLAFINCEILNKTSKTPSPSSIIYSDGPILFSNNGYLCFEKNTSEGSGTALHTPNLSIQRTFSFTFLEKNTAKENGGAIAASTANISNNYGSIIFSKNQAGDYGGAIYLNSGELKITNNSLAVSFANNSAQNGGAIYAHNNVLLSGNYCLSINANRATSSDLMKGCGGGIYAIKETLTSAAPKVTLSQNNKSSFYGNTADTCGGAIYAHQLVIASTGPTSFINNLAPKGSAIAIQESGDLQLSADFGDIIFRGNTSPESGIHNAIHLGSGATISKLQARKNTSIRFYDPITNDNPPSGSGLPELSINPRKENPHYTEDYSGSILFSGERISQKETSILQNLSSTLHHKVTLAGGELLLQKKVQLYLASFTQLTNSRLIMDMGTKLSTTDKENPNEGISVHALAIPLNTLNNTSPITLAVTTPYGAMKLSGSVEFINASNQNFYENHNLLDHQTAIFPLIELSATSGSIDTTDFSLLPKGDVFSPFGYQGTWKLFWEDSEKHKFLKASWHKTGYFPNPERLASIVPNTLWSVAMDLQAIQNLINSIDLISPHTFSVWGSAISNLFYTNSTTQLQSFHHNGCGYVAGAHLNHNNNLLGCLAGKLFGKNHDNFRSSSKTTTQAGAVYAQLATSWIKIAANLGYSESENSLTTRYQTFNTEIHGTWNNTCLSGEISSTFPIVLENNSHIFSSLQPFIKLLAFEAHQDAFEEEENKEARYFESSSIKDITIPIGIKLEKHSNIRPTFYSLLFAYSQNLYRESVSGTTTLKMNQISWPTPITEIDKHAFLFQIAGYKGVNQHLGIFANFSSELRKDSKLYRINCGSRLLF